MPFLFIFTVTVLLYSLIMATIHWELGRYLTCAYQYFMNINIILYNPMIVSSLQALQKKVLFLSEGLNNLSHFL
jgi:hypothetical protein